MSWSRLVGLFIYILASSVYGADMAISEPNGQLAGRLVDALGVDEPVFCAVQAGVELVHAQGGKTTSAIMQSEILDEITQVFFEERFSRQVLRDEIMAIYAELFTEEELREMVETLRTEPELIALKSLQQLEARGLSLLAGTILDEPFQKQYAAKLSEGDQRAEIMARITVPTPEPDNRTRIYIESRSNKLFRVSEHNRYDHGDDLSGVPECLSLFEQHEGSTADMASTPTNWFIPMLFGMKEGSAVISFIVRDDGFRVFKKARATAWMRKMQVVYEVLGIDEPLVFDSDGAPDVSSAPDHSGTRTQKVAALGEMRFSDKSKKALYIDVLPEQLILYPGEEVVLVEDLEQSDTLLAAMLATVSTRREEQYIVLVLRPGSAKVARRLKTIIGQQGIDVGTELWEKDRPLKIRNE